MADSKEDLYCPCCNKKMTKVFDSEKNIYIDICTEGCGGIFFDNREFKKYDEKDENIDVIMDALKGKIYTKVDDSADRYCPACGTKMVKHASSANGKIKIDECYSCGGIFLDYGELEQIRAEYNSENDRAKDFDKMFENIHKKALEEIENKHNQIVKKDKNLIRKAIKDFIQNFI